VEEELASIWAKTLSLDKVGIYDNFFDLGGHSLLATQIITRVIKSFKVKVSLQSLFQSPNVADMALAVSQNMAKTAEIAEIEGMLDELEKITKNE
jgi:acyl carrier protein